MGLDYNGLPKFKRERDLHAKDINPYLVDSFIESAPEPENEADALFDNIARAFLKGEALKAGLGNMNPAAFIPVEEESSVVSSIQRVFPGESSAQITFGQFKESCEELANRMASVDEDYIGSPIPVDPKLESTSFTNKHKGSSSNGDDWISAFLSGGSAFAGLMLAGFMQDVFGMNEPRTTIESNSSGDECKQWYAQGMPAGLSLLIELGVNFLSLQAMFAGSMTLSDEVAQEFDKLSKSPSKRKKILEAHGYDYEALRKNQKYDDHKAIKTYCLNYIASNTNQTNSYDHWLGWLQVTESQGIVKTAMATGPVFSRKWANFSKTNSQTYQEDEGLGERLENDLKIASEIALTSAMKGYLSSVATESMSAYDKAADSFSFRVDERLLCCMLYFLGPMDTGTLRLISSMLKLATFQATIRITDFISFLSESAKAVLLSMLTQYVSEIMDTVISKIIGLFNSVADNDLLMAIKLCLGMDILFKIFQYVVNKVVDFMVIVVEQLNEMLLGTTGKLTVAASVSVERKILFTFISMLDAIIVKYESLRGMCSPIDDNSGYNDEVIADAAVAFVANELPNLYPVLALPEDVRRKHFNSTPGFVSQNLKIEIPGFEDGIPGSAQDPDTAVNDCASNSSATKSAIVANNIINAFKSMTSNV
jgi:hypothetical protein